MTRGPDFRMTPREALLTLAMLGLLLLFLGGERVDCTAGLGDTWTCTRTSTVPVWQLLGVDELDVLTADQAARLAPEPSSWRRRGYAFEVQRHDGTRFCLPRQPSSAEAERDRQAFVAFCQAGDGVLRLDAPARAHYRFGFAAVTALWLGGTAWNARRWMRGEGLRRD
jgi:hypothetical protein